MSWKFEDICIFCKLWMVCHLSELRQISKCQAVPLCIYENITDIVSTSENLHISCSCPHCYIKSSVYGYLFWNCEVCIHMFCLTKQINACLDPILVIYLKQCILHLYGIGPSFTSYCIFSKHCPRKEHIEGWSNVSACKFLSEGLLGRL